MKVYNVKDIKKGPLTIMLCFPMSGKTATEVFQYGTLMGSAIIPYLHNEGYLVKQIMFNCEATDDTVAAATKPTDHLYFMGRGIKDYMTKADLIVFGPHFKNSRGCNIEETLCVYYNIPYIVFDDEEYTAIEEYINKFIE